MIGTPFISEDEVTQRKVDKINKKPWEQEVRDEKGRKRLHGAFTGGFSAGYFNTVGTKEGWTTQAFRSTRSDKIENSKNIKNQDVMDFLDEEDIKDQIGEQTITSKDIHKDYLSTLKPNNSDILKDNNYDDEKFTHDPSKELVPQFNNMIGNILMEEAGFIESDGKKNIYGNKNFNKNIFYNDNKYYQGKLEFKDDYSGVGYIPLMEDDIFKKNENVGNSKNRIKMDKFEDDEEFGYYTGTGINDKQTYNFEILDENYLNEKEKELKKKRFRENIDFNFEKNVQKFVKSENKLNSIENITFQMPKLPKDYDPFDLTNHENQNSSKKDEKYNIESEINKLTNKKVITSDTDQHQNNWGKLDANKRSEILDLDIKHNRPSNPYLENKFTKVEVFDFQSRTELDKILNDTNNNTNINLTDDKKKFINKAPSSVEQFNNYFHFKVEIPFKDDTNKISRFAKFVAEKEGLIMGDSNYTNKNLMNGTETKIERNIFEKLYNEEIRLRKLEQSNKTEIKNTHESESEELKERIEKIKNREVIREKIIWKPEKVLCKRFKLKDPFENKINNIVNSRFDNEKNNISFKKGETNYSMSSLQYQLFKQENPNVNINLNLNKPAEPLKDLKCSNNEKNVFDIVNSKTDVNLFEEIFGE